MLELKVTINSSQQQLVSAADFLEQLPEVDLSLLSAIPDIEKLVLELNKFLKDIINDIVSFIESLLEGLDWLAPELQKIQVMLDMIIASAKTFTGLLQASISINTNAGQEIMNYSTHAGFAGKMEAVLLELSAFIDRVVPDQQMLDDLSAQLIKMRDLLLNIRDNILL